MGYIIRSDYYKSIQEIQITQITRGDNNILLQAEAAAMSRARGMLSQKYEVDKEFTNTQLYSSTSTYKAADRVYVTNTYPAYNSATSYTLGNNCMYNGNAYVCISATTGVFNVACWQALSGTVAIYYAAYPYPYFDLYGVYAVNDKAFYKGKSYRCKQATGQISNFVAVQYGYEDNIPPANVFPDDPSNGAQAWEDLGAYVVPAGKIGADAYDADTGYAVGDYAKYDNSVFVCLSATTGQFNPDAWRVVWAYGDNRDQLMVTSIVDIALWYAHKAIAPNNIPDLRTDAYNVAIEWFRKVRDGIEQAVNMPLIQPKQGRRILSDSRVTRNNYY